ncbi:putative integral membrane protein conserved region-domain-containing protein [Armillaria novae-zelandiae]|uniref:Integral membrane protein conserved region-domain-containing protein n=1 Tax=Armillaria novae-zelandiae TaxID=153914 RepID=A0AA39U9W2_9AGAR|nr:putative integral membrane protein conserved region-domain-containing protein [Armillaria novae-zelandiae]
MKLDGDDVGNGPEDCRNQRKRRWRRPRRWRSCKTIISKEEAVDSNTPWFIFVRSNVEMEDWYLSLVHASDHPAQTPQLSPLQAIFLPSDMNLLVTTLDEQPDVIPMRWLNALIGRKLSKIKRPTFLADIVVTQVSVGNTTPTFSKPMLKELTKEGDASLEIHLLYKGEVRITVEATANINLGTFKSYNVKLVLAVVLKEIEGNLLVKVKRPPSSRIWYAFTQMPRMVLEVEPIVSDRQITWSMILSTIESRLKEIIQESVVLPNMDDIAFFESLSHQHRGGIWPDAARHPGPQRVPDQSTKDTGTEIDAVEPLEMEQPPLVQKATSLQEQTIPLTEPPLLTPSSTEPGFPHESSPLNRRRTWFSTNRNDEKLLSDDRENSATKDGDEARGRSVDVGKITLARSHSAPGEPEVNRIGDGSDDSTSDNAESHLSVNDGRRPSSRASSISDDQGKGKGPASVSRSSSRSHKDPPPSPSPETTRVPPASPSATSSFLSTLKSKAGDKQALSNSAKETMRKWGVNWGNLRKERVASTSSLSQKARTSYAEVRAAVAERLRSVEESKPSSSSDALSRTRTVSSSMLAPSQPSPRPDLSDSALPPDDDAPENPIHVQPQAKTMSIPGIHASHKGNVMSMGYVAPPVSPPPESKKNPVLRLWKSPGSGWFDVFTGRE